jgi:hypothetical protein
MRKHARLAGLMTLIAGLALGGSAPAATQAAASPWVQALTQEALDSGFLSRLPPNISVVFGLAKGQEGTDVRQLLDKQGHQVRTFNVSVANHADVVIFNVNTQSGTTVAYLLTPEGKLRKAVSYATGGQARELSAADAKAGLAHEKHFWSARVKKTPSSTPAAPAAPAPKGGSGS